MIQATQGKPTTKLFEVAFGLGFVSVMWEGGVLKTECQKKKYQYSLELV